MAQQTKTLLEVQNLSVHYATSRLIVGRSSAPTLKAVDGVSLTLRAGEVVGLVGESGCGKSTLARAILRLVPATAGRVLLDGKDVGGFGEASPVPIHRQLQMVFQDPFGSLNPRMTAGDALTEPLAVHGICPRSEIPSEVRRLLELVGLDHRFLNRYPHECSGGQRQRIAIARALAVQPRFLIADEPVSALDVSIQAQIINLFSRLVADLGIGLLFIAHDLAVVRHVSNRVAVMYLGKIVECGDAERVIGAPAHPYTRALVAAAPTPDPVYERNRTRPLMTGEPPSPLAPPSGCPFHPRCPYAIERCRGENPLLAPLSDRGEHESACLRSSEI